MIGLDEHMDWIDDSACAGNPEPFDLYEKDSEMAEISDQMCLSCPVIGACFSKGSKGEFGQWGGVYWANGKPDFENNRHKSKEYMQEVSRLVISTLPEN